MNAPNYEQQTVELGAQGTAMAMDVNGSARFVSDVNNAEVSVGILSIPLDERPRSDGIQESAETAWREASGPSHARSESLKAQVQDDVHITPTVVRVTQTIAWNCVCVAPPCLKYCLQSHGHVCGRGHHRSFAPQADAQGPPVLLSGILLSVRIRKPEKTAEPLNSQMG
eukprot:1182902-Prorocentrum_minimum.AAC.2